MPSIRKPRQPAAPKRGDKNKAMLELILRAQFGAKLDTEHVFHPVRKWRFDYAVPALKLAVEYQGHGHMGRAPAGATAHIGGHANVSGLANDCEKLNAAAGLGWTVLKFTALHFREADRKKHKLTSVHDTLRHFTP